MRLGLNFSDSMFYLVLTTTKGRAEAKRITDRIIREKLAACVNIVPNTSSTYHWKGKIERSRETLLLIKTSGEKLDKLIKKIKELHSYEVPEIIALPIERGLPKYLKWLKGSLR
jgi:periplasmic divalent cation tolerance protein